MPPGSGASRGRPRWANRFAVSESFVRDLSALHRQTGDVATRPRGGGRQALATPAALAQLTGLVAAHHDHTIGEHHRSMLAAGFALSAVTVGRRHCTLVASQSSGREESAAFLISAAYSNFPMWPKMAAPLA